MPSRFIRSEQPEALRRGLGWLYAFVRPQRGAILRLLALSLLASALVLLQPWLTKLLIDDGLLARDYPTLVMVAAAMIGAGLAGTALAGINRLLHTRLSGTILFALRSDFYRHLQGLSPSFYGRQRLAVAVVSQDIVLFRGTLADNIRYAMPAADDEAVWLAARRARLDELVAALPQGLATPLAERGQQLSGGQRQRIAIARALLQDPCVLVLDEATSAVDEATEAAVIAEVDALFADRTRILVSYRATTRVGCELELRLEAGRLEPVVRAQGD